MRFWNNDILNQVEAVKEVIASYLIIPHSCIKYGEQALAFPHLSRASRSCDKGGKGISCKESSTRGDGISCRDSPVKCEGTSCKDYPVVGVES